MIYNDHHWKENWRKLERVWKGKWRGIGEKIGENFCETRHQVQPNILKYSLVP